MMGEINISFDALYEKVLLKKGPINMKSYPLSIEHLNLYIILIHASTEFFLLLNYLYYCLVFILF